jgi:hypothetical protein
VRTQLGRRAGEGARGRCVVRERPGPLDMAGAGLGAASTGTGTARPPEAGAVLLGVPLAGTRRGAGALVPLGHEGGGDKTRGHY